MTNPDIQRLRELVERWRGEMIRLREFSLGFSPVADTLEDCADELEIELDKIERSDNEGCGSRGEG